MIERDKWKVLQFSTLRNQWCHGGLPSFLQWKFAEIDSGDVFEWIWVLPPLVVATRRLSFLVRSPKVLIFTCHWNPGRGCSIPHKHVPGFWNHPKPRLKKNLGIRPSKSNPSKKSHPTQHLPIYPFHFDSFFWKQLLYFDNHPPRFMGTMLLLGGLLIGTTKDPTSSKHQQKLGESPTGTRTLRCQGAPYTWGAKIESAKIVYWNPHMLHQRIPNKKVEHL